VQSAAEVDESEVSVGRRQSRLGSMRCKMRTGSGNHARTVGSSRCQVSSFMAAQTTDGRLGLSAGMIAVDGGQGRVGRYSGKARRTLKMFAEARRRMEGNECFVASTLGLELAKVKPTLPASLVPDKVGRIGEGAGSHATVWRPLVVRRSRGPTALRKYYQRDALPCATLPPYRSDSPTT
jgi:hypothetical protein